MRLVGCFSANIVITLSVLREREALIEFQCGVSNSQ